MVDISEDPLLGGYCIKKNIQTQSKDLASHHRASRHSKLKITVILQVNILHPGDYCLRYR